METNQGSDKKIQIGYFPGGKEISLEFTVDGEQPNLDLYPMNEKEDVELIKTSVRQQQQDEDVIRVTAHGVGFRISPSADFSRYELPISADVAKIATDA